MIPTTGGGILGCIHTVVSISHCQHNKLIQKSRKGCIFMLQSAFKISNTSPLSMAVASNLSTQIQILNCGLCGGLPYSFTSTWMFAISDNLFITT